MEILEPHRATHRSAFRLNGDADSVFSLMCPVRELDWLESWSPGVVYSATGIIESECVFSTSDENGQSTWFVSHYDPELRHVEIVKFTPGFTTCLLKVSVRPLSAMECEVSVSYSHTALSEAGSSFVEGFTEDAYTRFMAQWQSALDYYLTHGSAMPGS